MARDASRAAADVVGGTVEPPDALIHAEPDASKPGEFASSMRRRRNDAVGVT